MQQQLVTEVLDTVDFGVVRFSVGGDVVYENDAVGRLGGSCPDCTPRAETRVLLQEDGETPLDAHDHPLARARQRKLRGQPCGRRMPRGGASR